MPPEFNKLPVPKSSKNIQENETENNIENLISNNDTPENSEIQNENFENSIIEKIKQN